MTDVMRDEVKLVTDDEGHYLNMDEHLAAPIICYFNLLDASYYQSMELEPPYGAMIYRNNVDLKKTAQRGLFLALFSPSADHPALMLPSGHLPR